MSATCCTSTKAGGVCRATVVAGTNPPTCFMHSELAADAQRKGGERRGREANLRCPALDDLPAIKRFLRRCVDKSIAGDLSGAEAATIMRFVDGAIALIRVEKDLDVPAQIEELRALMSEARSLRLAPAAPQPAKPNTPRALGPLVPQAVRDE